MTSGRPPVLVAIGLPFARGLRSHVRRGRLRPVPRLRRNARVDAGLLARRAWDVADLPARRRRRGAAGPPARAALDAALADRVAAGLHPAARALDARERASGAYAAPPARRGRLRARPGRAVAVADRGGRPRGPPPPRPNPVGGGRRRPRG